MPQTIEHSQDLLLAYNVIMVVLGKQDVQLSQRDQERILAALERLEEAGIEQGRCPGCGKSLVDAVVEGHPVLSIGDNTYVLWDTWHIVTNGILEPFQGLPRDLAQALGGQDGFERGREEQR